MTSDFYSTPTSWFPGNICIKPHSKHSGGGGTSQLPDFGRNMIQPDLPLPYPYAGTPLHTAKF